MRSIHVRFCDPEALAVVLAICEVLADTEECAHVSSLVTEGSGGGTESRPPQGDRDALSTLAGQVSALRRVLGETARERPDGASTGMYGRLDRLVTRQTSYSDAAPDYTGAEAAGVNGAPRGKGGRPKATRAEIVSGIVARAREAGIISDN